MEYDLETYKMLRRAGVDPRPVAPAKIPSGQLPYTSAGLPGLMIRHLPELEHTNTLAFVLDSPVIGREMLNRGLQQNIFARPTADAATYGHEIEHLLARQNLGSSLAVREKFTELLGNTFSERLRNQNSFLTGLEKALPYLKEKYGVDDAYMTSKFIQSQGQVGLNELLSTLGGIESAHNVDLTKDPELRKTVFSSRPVREAYSAVTGLRQTRLDPRDIAPYTKIEEPVEPGVMNKIKRMLGYSFGGHVPHAGNKKLL